MKYEYIFALHSIGATQVEDTKLIQASADNQTELEVEILVAPKPHQDVRPIGFDIPLGSLLVEKG